MPLSASGGFGFASDPPEAVSPCETMSGLVSPGSALLCPVKFMPMMSEVYPVKPIWFFCLTGAYLTGVAPEDGTGVDFCMLLDVIPLNLKQLFLV